MRTQACGEEGRANANPTPARVTIVRRTYMFTVTLRTGSAVCKVM